MSDGETDVCEDRRSRDRRAIPRVAGVGLVFAMVAVALFAGVGAADGHYGPDRFEPNDYPEEAAPISEGSYEGLTIYEDHGEQDGDFFAIQVEGGNRLEAEISFTHADGNLELVVLDPDLYAVDESHSMTDDEAVTVDIDQSGTYYVLVYGADEDVTNAYDLEVSVTEGGSDTGSDSELNEDRFEPNDEFDTAAFVDEGWYSDLTVRDGGTDFYAIDLEEGDRLEAWIEFAHAESNLDLVVYDPDRRILDVSDSADDFEDVTAEAPRSGTYYVAVYDAGGNSNQYGLEVYVEEGAASDDDAPELDADQYEPNDNPEEAAPISPGSYGGLTIRDGGVDFYAIDLAAGDRLEAAIEFAHADLDLVVMDPSNDVVDYSASGTGSEELAIDAAQDGTHYVIVTAVDDSASVEYGLDVNVEAGAGGDPGTPDDDDDATDPNGDRFESNDEFDEATPIEEGTHPDLDVRDGNSDFYAIDLVEGARLEASIDFAHADGDLDLALYGPDRDQRDASYSTNDGEAVSIEAFDPGTYYVEVYGFNGASNEYDLEISLEKPRYDLSVVESDDALAEGETLAVTVEYTNVGELAGPGDIELVVDGETVDSSTAALALGATGEATLEWEVDDADVETVSVRSADDEVTIVDRTEEEETDEEDADGNESDDDDESDDSDDGVPSNPALAVVALVATALVIARRA